MVINLKSAALNNTFSEKYTGHSHQKLWRLWQMRMKWSLTAFRSQLYVMLMGEVSCPGLPCPGHRWSTDSPPGVGPLHLMLAEDASGRRITWASVLGTWNSLGTLAKWENSSAVSHTQLGATTNLHKCQSFAEAREATLSTLTESSSL